MDGFNPRETVNQATTRPDGDPEAPRAGGGRRPRGGELDRLAVSLGSRVGRTLFRRDELTYAARFGLTRIETKALVNRDWRALLDLGGSAACIVRIAAADARTTSAGRRGIEHELFVKTVSGRR
ncbi:MAG: hypothetical protein WD470_09950 [Rhodospirillaceae bacterium]